MELRPAYLLLATLTLIPVTVATVLVEGLSYRWLPLLALDAQSDHAIGAWNSSLEYAPSWRCLPEQVRRTWEPGAQAPTAGGQVGGGPRAVGSCSRPWP